MKISRHSAPEVNAGSMADIAFLLLIFFLVVTTISADKVIERQLPKICPPNTDCSEGIPERNILRVLLNGNDDIFIEDRVVQIQELKDIAKAFLDNNGDASCDYCRGLKDHTSSDNPKEAVISLENNKMTSYEMYIAVQDELTKAYYELRNEYAINVMKKSAKHLSKNDLKELKKVYPFILSEAQTVD